MIPMTLAIPMKLAIPSDAGDPGDGSHRRRDQLIESQSFQPLCSTSQAIRP